MVNIRRHVYSKAVLLVPFLTMGFGNLRIMSDIFTEASSLTSGNTKVPVGLRLRKQTLKSMA